MDTSLKIVLELLHLGCPVFPELRASSPGALVPLTTPASIEGPKPCECTSSYHHGRTLGTRVEIPCQKMAIFVCFLYFFCIFGAQPGMGGFVFFCCFVFPGLRGFRFL